MNTDLFWAAAGSGPAVVLLHSGLTDSRAWRSTVPALAERFTVVTYDARGFGRSPDPTAPWSPVNDLLGVMSAAGLGSAHLVGNSQGAGVARYALASHPSLATSLTLVGAGLPGLEVPDDSREAGRRFGAAMEARDLQTALAAARELWLEGPEQERWAAEVLARPHQHRARPAQAPKPEEVAVPSLVVVGDRDASINQLAARELARRIPDARLEVIPNAKHHPQLDNPDAFNRVLVDFLGQQRFV